MQVAPSSRSFAQRLGSAALNVGRAAVLLGGFYALMAARVGESPRVVAGLLVAWTAAMLLLAGRSRRLRVWTGYMVALVLFALLRTFGDETGIPVRFDYVVDAERALFAGAIPTVWLQERLLDSAAGTAASLVFAAIYFSYYLGPHVLALALLARRSPHFLRYALALISVNYVGLAVCFALPTAPPWLAAQTGAIPAVERVIPMLTGADAHARGSELVGGNAVAAMPSLHAAAAFVVLLLAWRRPRVVRALGVTYGLGMAVGLVYLGEHYVVDALAGFAVAVAAWAAAGLAQEKAAVLRRGRLVPAPASGTPLAERA